MNIHNYGEYSGMWLSLPCRRQQNEMLPSVLSSDSLGFTDSRDTKMSPSDFSSAGGTDFEGDCDITVG